VAIVARVNSDACEGKQFLQDQLSRINYLKNVDHGIYCKQRDYGIILAKSDHSQKLESHIILTSWKQGI